MNYNSVIFCLNVICLGVFFEMASRTKAWRLSNSCLLVSFLRITKFEESVALA